MSGGPYGPGGVLSDFGGGRGGVPKVYSRRDPKKRSGLKRTWEQPEDSGTSAPTVHANNSKTKPEIIFMTITMTITLVTCKDLQCLPCV